MNGVMRPLGMANNTAPASPFASRLMSAVAVGALATAAAAAGAASLITASASPSVWLAAYEHSRECAQPQAALDPSCSAAAAQSLADQRLALRLEQEAQKLDATPAPDPSAQDPSPADTSPAAAPPSNPAPVPVSHSDDSGEGTDD